MCGSVGPTLIMNAPVIYNLQGGNMLAALITLVVLALLTGTLSVLAMLRSYWIADKLEGVALLNLGDFSSYWSYERIFWHFWIWDIKKMRKPGAD